MAKESDLNRDRMEEAFSALSGGAKRAPGPSGGRPWKVAALLLLLISLALPMAYGIRESEREREHADRVAEANREAGEAHRALEAGDIGRAVLSLERASARLADVELTDRVALGVKAAVEEKLAELTRVREDLGRRRGGSRRQIEALDSLQEGDAEKAAEVLAVASRSDPVARALLVLARRLVRWDLGERAEGESRVVSLAALAKDWPLPALRRAAERAAGRARTLQRIRETVGEAAAGMAREDFEGARDRLVAVLRQAEVPPRVEGLFEEIGTRRRRARARQLEGEGAGAGAGTAAALYRTLAVEEGDAEAAMRADVLENAVRRDYLLRTLAEIVDESRRRGDFPQAAMAAGLIERVEGRGVGDYRLTDDWARGLTRRARELFEAGETEAALVAAREAASLGLGEARSLVSRIEDDVREKNAASSRSLALRRAREAADAGAPALAARILEQAGIGDAPPGLSRRIEVGRREEAVAGARASLQAGDPAGALGRLEGAELLDDPDLARLAARALLRTGDVDGGLALLPEKSALRMFELVRAALALPLTDRAGFAALVERALEETGPRADLQAALALALEDSGRGEDAKSLWIALRDAALKRAPLPAKQQHRGPVEK